MSIRFRQFESEDFFPSLEFFNKRGISSEVTARMWKRMMLLDPNFDAGWFIIAEDEEKMVGMVYAIRRLVPVDVGGDLEPEKAWINAFAVLPEYVDSVGAQLLDKAEALASGAGAKTLTATSYTPNYFIQGIDIEAFPEYLKLFESRGYKLQEASNSMRLDLTRYEYSEKSALRKEALARENIRFATLSEDKLLSLFDYMRSQNKPGWTCRVRKLLLCSEDLTRVHIALDGEKVIGFNIYGDVDTDIRRYGPYGVDPTYRGKGIGRVLLEECLRDMKEAGLEYAWLSWASGDRAPILYRAVGFEITGEYNTYTKELA